MQKLTYDYYNNIEIPTFVLSNIYHHHIGVINNIDTESIQFNFNMNSQQEVSCDVYKELNGEKCELWDKIISLKYIYIPEHEEYYKLDVTVDDGEYTVKHLTLTSAGEYELSNKYITLEINTESDILRNVDDTTNPPYAPNVLYNPNDVDNSILHRVLKDKAPDWSIVHCDESIANIQRTFTISNQKIYDVLTNTLAKEYNCLFKFDSVKREIYCYDLYNRCEECGERGEFVYECPQCGSKKIQYGYGKNTNIFITYNNFSEKITLDGDEGAVKNCFRVTGGDDYMNATVRNINPNGSDYIYNFSQNDYDDMPTELVEGLQAYQEKYDELLEPYQEYTEKWYDAINNYYFYKTSMMPRSNGILWEANKGYNLNDETYVKSLATWAYLKCVKAGVSGDEMFDATNASDGQLFEDGTVVWQVVKHIISIPSAEESYNAIVEYFQDNIIYFQREIPSSVTLVNNEIVNMAKLAINNIFKVEVVIDGTNKVVGNTWYGRLKVTNSGNSEDTYKPDSPLAVTIGVYDNILSYTKYIEDKVVKRINKADTAFINVYDLDYPDVYPYSKDADTVFKALLTQYGLDSLSSFSKSYQSCLDVLVANGIKDKNSTYQDSDYMVWDIYTPIYLPIYGRKELVDEEIERRETTVNRWAQLRDDYRAEMDNIQNQLKLQNFLGDDLFKIFFSYIREDNYNNSNYISTGISDGEVISYAKLLLNTAEKELKKACELQITLSDNIKNLLNTDEFKNYKDNYNIGDYIFVECDGDDWDGGDVNNGLYRLRLISASYSFSSPGDINFTFSNATKLNNFFSDAQSIINAAQSINGSYQVVVHQIEKTTNVTDNISDVIDHGFSATNSILANNNNEEVSMGDYGIYAKEYDDITNDYSPKQLRITHNILALTDDNWETTKVAIGENHYRFYNTDPQRGAIGWTEVDDYGVNANFVQGGYIIGGEIIGTEVVSSNYQVADPSQGIKADGSYINLNDGSFTLAGGGLVGYRNQDGTYYLNYKGDVTGVLDVDVGSTLGVWTVGADGFYSGSSVVKPDHISVTGNIRANDFFVGTSTTTRLSTILDNKQDLLTAGDYISIDSTTNRISATYSVFTGATSEADGEAGLVKKPLVSDRTKFLCGDGTWAVPTGGTSVEPNPVEPATDTLNSIKIDDTVYEIVGGDGDVNLYHGVPAPSNSLGDDGDIYIQLAPDTNSLNELHLSDYNGELSNTFTNNNLVYTYKAEYNHSPWYDGRCFGFDYLGLEEGKTYLVRFDAQSVDGSWSGSGDRNQSRFYGLAYQKQNNVVIHNGTQYEHVANGGFEYLSQFGDGIYYQSFFYDHEKHTYEFEFVATQSGYLCFYADDFVPYEHHHIEITNFYVVDVESEGSEINKTYYKLNDEWVEAEVQGGDGGSNIYYGTEEPSANLGVDRDLYCKLGDLPTYILDSVDYSTLNQNAITKLAYNEFSCEINGTMVTGGAYQDKQYFILDGLIEGNTYTLTVRATLTAGTIHHYSTGELSSNYFAISNDATGEHDRFLFALDETFNVEQVKTATFVAGSNNVLVFAFFAMLDGRYAELQADSIKIEGNFRKIVKIYDKVGNGWVDYEGGESYTAGDNIDITNNVISGAYQPFTGTDGTADGASGLVPAPTAADDDKVLGASGQWVEQSGGTEVEANPSGVATENLYTVDIDGTIYDIKSGNGNFKTKVLLNQTATSGSYSLADDYTNYDLLAFWTTGQGYESGEAGVVVMTVDDLKKAQADNRVLTMFGYYNRYYNFYITPSQFTVQSRNDMTVVKIVGYKIYADCYNPIIYSTEEREVGVWIDNKPLYKKSYILQSLILINNNGTNINNYIDNVATIEQITNAEACNNIANLQTSNIFVGKSNNNLTAYCAEAGSFNIITLWYTKTTDVAGSGQYNTLGVPTVHYNENEQVVGTFFGKTLYQKSEHIILSTPISPNTDTTVNFSNFSNITSFLSLEAVGGLYGNSDHVTATYGFWEQSTSGSSSGDRIIKEWDMSHMVVRTGSNYNNFPSAGVDNTIREFWVTMRYTKD